jgi:3-oxoacyl-[acyl-carrier protein] reductase
MSEQIFAGQVAWVTGSSRGIGRVIAHHLASLGARVVVHGTSAESARAFGEAESLDAVASGIAEQTRAEVLAVHGDLTSSYLVPTTDELRVEQLVTQIHERFSRVDILVNCAGGDIGVEGTMGPNAGKPANNDAVHVSVADMRRVLDRNLIACILPCRSIALEMMARRSGRIVNIGSVSGLAGRATEAIYATAKAAVHEYTRCLAAQMRPYNVYVNAIAPGPIVTPRFLASRRVDEALTVPGGTLQRYGQPQEIANVVAFLASDSASFISGQVLRADGGEQLWPA